MCDCANNAVAVMHHYQQISQRTQGINQQLAQQQAAYRERTNQLLQNRIHQQQANAPKRKYR